MPAITTGVKHFCWQYLVGCLWERKPFLGGKTALRRNPTESFRKNFKMTSRFSLREALLVSLVLVDRSFFFCIVFFWTSGTVDGNSMLPDEGARLDQKGVGFFSV